LAGGLGSALTGGSGQRTFDSSGKVASFWICNVGKNGKEEFNTGSGDDICQLINLNTGQPLGVFPGLDKQTAERLVNRAINALQEAGNQYGNKLVRINGVEYPAKVAAHIPSTQCQDFMSPKDCHLMFNVCDPVICPASRCNFGGAYQVADVVQTGIVGSALLCLPNIKEGIAIPVCLSGIHAGIEGYVSILKSHRDCLQENIETGRYVGICDEITAIYMCEFFWRQVAPVANVLLPKLVEYAYGGGQGTRGGGEYMTTMAAWQNMQNSIDYFKQTYAVNSFKAFNIRSVEEAGTEFCRASLSSKIPTNFDSLLEPDSPSQFHAWFSSTIFNDVTLPATGQYKVFYHIFAGNDAGVRFNVYLKNPSEANYYSIPQTIQVATGFIAKGQYATETKDFTAPEGYKELCVRINNKEKCGFKQVSTSFAVNYLRDEFVKDELTNNDIGSEKECIAGSPSLAPLLNPNIQAGAEEAGIPEIYNRGIVRICATNNPGSGTDPTRFVLVGICDDPKIKCWLDKKSVDNAITDGNYGAKNASLKELSEINREELERQGYLLDNPSSNAEINFISERVNNIINSINNGNVKAKQAEVSDLIKRIDTLYPKLVLNGYKASLLLQKARLKGAVAMSLLNTTANIQTLETNQQANSNNGNDNKCIVKLLNKTNNEIKNGSEINLGDIIGYKIRLKDCKNKEMKIRMDNNGGFVYSDGISIEEEKEYEYEIVSLSSLKQNGDKIAIIFQLGKMKILINNEEKAEFTLTGGSDNKTPDGIIESPQGNQQRQVLV